jgi:hypothetical protein
MTSADPRSQSSAWSRAEPPAPAPPRSALAHFLGGSPGAVLVRLLIMSLLVGLLLMWLDIRPEDIVEALNRFVRHICNLGFDAIREAATYILAGALIVVPIWFLARLFNVRSLR